MGATPHVRPKLGPHARPQPGPKANPPSQAPAAQAVVLASKLKTEITEFYNRNRELLDVMSTAADDALRKFEEILKMKPEKSTFLGVFETVVRLGSILIPGMPAARAMLSAAGATFGVTEESLKKTHMGVEASAWAQAGAEAWKQVYQTVKPDVTSQDVGLATLEKIHEAVAAAKEKAVDDQNAAEKGVDALLELNAIHTLNVLLPTWQSLPRSRDFVKLSRVFRSMMLYELVRRHVAANVSLSAYENSWGSPTGWDIHGMNRAQMKHIIELFHQNNAGWMDQIPAPIRLRRMKPVNGMKDFHDVLGARLKLRPERHSTGMKV
jgi:hypothetical protein